MDFTNLEETAREAKLEYGQAESLVRFCNFKRERRGQLAISVDYSRLGEQLSAVYAEVDFKIVDYRFVARAKCGAGGSLVDRIGLASSNIPHLATTVGFGFESFPRAFMDTMDCGRTLIEIIHWFRVHHVRSGASNLFTIFLASTLDLERFFQVSKRLSLQCTFPSFNAKSVHPSVNIPIGV
ncbi:MAG: hypothetical protein J2P21_22725 [Chloracidobacterium sp.]|nr:hypothetical protein [Chloracidobacterium sp.]